MNFIAQESQQKLRGGYYTDLDIASFLTRWLVESKPRRILEPSCGDGNFFDALAAARHDCLESVVGCELNPEEASKAERRAKSLNGTLDVFVGDFLLWSLERAASAPLFDAVLGNPPFIRYQYLDATLQARAEQIFQRFNLAFTRHTNAWVPFVIASLAMLRPGGRLAMVVPSELLHVIHARSLRHFLLEQCSRVLVIDPEDIWFGDTLQGVVLLLAEKRCKGEEKTAQVSITAVRGRDALKRPAREYFEKGDFFPGSILNGKWMLGLLTRSERRLFAALEGNPAIRSFADVATVDVGIVTGANKFFLVPDAVVEQYQLHAWAHPMYGRSEHVGGVIYTPFDHARNKRSGLPANFLWFNDDPPLSASAREYIALGERESLHKRFKCRVRSPWYCVPSVYVAPVGMLKRCHHLPRLILNKAKAYTTDTAYRVSTKKGVSAIDFVGSFVNSLTALSAELEGRHYGGGVLELVPSEIERILVPLSSISEESLASLDKAIRDGAAPENLLALQDSVVLRPLGVKRAECEELLTAWDRLRNRRQRVTTEE